MSYNDMTHWSTELSSTRAQTGLYPLIFADLVEADTVSGHAARIYHHKKILELLEFICENLLMAQRFPTKYVESEKQALDFPIRQRANRNSMKDLASMQ